LRPATPLVRYGRYGALAFEFSGTIAGGVIVGYYLDRWLGSPPYATVVCTLAAVVGGFVRMIQALRGFDRLDRDGEP
jgi:F0F1-type ATP synthase assembly protein I